MCLPVDSGKRKVILLTYVDDLGLFGDAKLIQYVKEELRHRFKITALGHPSSSLVFLS